jgi:outer membrane protein OmpA-like peptidoglycan-associated protein/tetratricopeptide (TPR) repeat protein
MKKQLIYALILLSSFGFAQEKKVKKAANNFNNYAYADAIASYESLVDQGYTNIDIYKNLGNANYLNAKYKEASDWYGKLLAMDGIEVEPDYIYRYAQTLKSIGNYEESDAWMVKFRNANESDLRAKIYTTSPDYLERIKKQSGRYTINNVSINSSASDFAPSFNNDKLIFSTARDTGITSRKIHDWNNKPFLNLYSATISESGDVVNPTRIGKSLNTKTHESSTAFTKEGTTVYFTRNNSKKGKFSRDQQGISRLKIYRATIKNGKWKKAKELPFNSDMYSVAHPTLNADETKLYFASDMPGTHGASDIYVVDINSDGTYGTPVNLGNQINTEGRETMPFITDSNILYFSSDGHQGLGGLDVFASKIDDTEDPYVLNIGEPVNSPQDDFTFIIDETNGNGYFASNRDGGIGDDDIYSFIETKPIEVDCKTVVEGIVKDQKTLMPLPESRISLRNANNEIIAETVSEADGSFNLEGECEDGEYLVTGFKEDYTEGTNSFTLVNDQDTRGVEILLAPIRKAAPVGTDLAKYLDLDPIYFDFDRFHIREDAKQSIQKVIAYMKEYPIVNIRIGSHTDSRATKAYNVRLSNKRANATMEYVIEQGIDPFRVSAVGLGETMLANHCSDGVLCTKHEHQENRRSEFIVVD